MYFLGVESAASQTRAIVVDLDGVKIVASATTPHTFIEGLPLGSREQDPAMWVAALDQTVKKCLHALGEDRNQVVAMSIGAQSKGLVLLDEDNKVLRPAKVTKDRSAIEQMRSFYKNFGGMPGLSELIGNQIEKDSFASHLLWMKECESAHFNKASSAMQPREFLNFWLTGVKKTEVGDVSRTGLFDVRNRKRSRLICDFISPDLSEKLSPIAGSGAGSDKLLGPLRTEIAQSWGLKKEVLVGIGSGRAMMRALGAGAVNPNTAVLDLGSSGSLWGATSSAQVDPRSEVDLWCDATHQWITHFEEDSAVSSLEMVRKHYQWTQQEMEAAAGSAVIGSGGLMAFPLGNRMTWGRGTGMFHGITPGNFTQANIARAIFEGVAYDLGFGFHRMIELGHDFRDIRVTGRASQSPFWRQIIADVSGVPSCTLVTHEGAALGAVMHAAVAYFQERGETRSFAEMVDYSVLVDRESWCEPDPQSHEFYQGQLSKHAYLAETIIGEGFIL